MIRELHGVRTEMGETIGAEIVERRVRLTISRPDGAHLNAAEARHLARSLYRLARQIEADA